MTYIISEESGESDNELLRNIAKAPSTRRKKGKNFILVNKFVIYILLGLIFILLLIILKREYDIAYSSSMVSVPPADEEKKVTCKKKIYCKDPLIEATRGRWIEGSFNETKVEWEEDDVEEIRRRFNLPKNMARDDMRCGIFNPIPNTCLPSLCDPKSEDLYCCSESSGWCGSSMEHCEGGIGTFNTRNKISPLKAKWQPSNDKCNLKTFSVEEACNIISESAKRIVFLGDSQARHLFTTLVLFLSGNYKDGAIKEELKSDKYVKENCTSEYQLINRNCRNYIVTNLKLAQNICSNVEEKVDISYLSDYYSFVSIRTSSMFKSMYDQADSYVIIGAGTHFNSDSNSFRSYYLKSITEDYGNKMWPKLIIETLHNVYATKSNERRKQFNEAIETFSPLKSIISIFQNSMLTENLQSYDGRTYGLKYNLLKIQILLHHFYNKNTLCI